MPTVNPIDPLVVEEVRRAVAISLKRGRSDVTFADLFEAVFGRQLSPALVKQLAEAVALAEDRGDQIVTPAHLMIAEIRGDPTVFKAWLNSIEGAEGDLLEVMEHWLERRASDGGLA